MTTIAYNHKDKEIAVDSRDTANGVIMNDDANKVQIVNGITFASCGSVYEVQKLIKAYIDGSTDKYIIDANAVVICDRGVFKIGMNDEDGLWENKVEYNYGTGSGGEWAMAAMDFGCSAKEAVEYAMTRDIYSGGEAKVIKVK